MIADCCYCVISRTTAWKNILIKRKRILYIENERNFIGKFKLELENFYSIKIIYISLKSLIIQILYIIIKK